MALEIRITSGARAGQVQRFEQDVIVVGRQVNVDLRFDPQQDLDVSGRHAELRVMNGKYFVLDSGSTNGTFVNGERIQSSRELSEGDTVKFGAKGPTVEIHISGSTGSHPRQKARSTETRIAMAVSQQTAGLKRVMIAAVVVIVAGVGAMFFYSRRSSTQRVEELKKIVSVNDSLRAVLQGTMQVSGDTSFVNEMQRKLTALQQRLPKASTDAERAQITTEMQQYEQQLRRIVQIDMPTIHARNAPATAIMISEIDGRPFAGTAFGITPEGLLVTNRHNVQNPDGQRASRLAVKFTDTRDWLPATVVKVSDDPDVDLAIIKMERPATYPAVEGLSANGSYASEGMTVVTIGYPSGYATPMEGSGNDFLAKSSLSPGTVSKKTSTVLQIDSYATHGSSGSPVFSTRGLVVGVVYAGLSEAGGKIVYAVPAEKLAAFIPEANKGVVKP